MTLVVRALQVHRVARPQYLLLQVVATVALVFVLMLQGEHLVPERFTGNAVPPIILPAGLAAAWFSVAVRVALSSRGLPWARRAAPLFLGMGIAELLRVLDAGRVDTWTFSGVLVCASTACARRGRSSSGTTGGSTPAPPSASAGPASQEIGHLAHLLLRTPSQP